MTSGLGRSDTGPTPYLQEDHKFLAKQGDKNQSECSLELWGGLDFISKELGGVHMICQTLSWDRDLVY